MPSPAALFDFFSTLLLIFISREKKDSEDSRTGKAIVCEKKQQAMALDFCSRMHFIWSFHFQRIRPRRFHSNCKKQIHAGRICRHLEHSQPRFICRHDRQQCRRTCRNQIPAALLNHIRYRTPTFRQQPISISPHQRISLCLFRSFTFQMADPYQNNIFRKNLETNSVHCFSPVHFTSCPFRVRHQHQRTG